MHKPRSLGWPITLAVVMILLAAAVGVGWVLGFSKLAQEATNSAVYWTLLALGAIFLLIIIAGVVWYLVISVKEIRLNERQNNFVASVTHELKSPLASIKLYLQTLDRRALSEEQRADFNRFMLEDVERLDALINHLLDAARMQDRPLDSAPVEIDLTSLLTECIKTCRIRYRLPEDAVQLESAPIVIVNRGMEAELLFRNLVDNAMKYAGAPPRIEIKAAMYGQNEALIRISDNGPGIPSGLRRKIFGRFFRVGNELVRSKPGTGLGLYIVREAVSRLRGQISVRGKGNEPGAVFEVRLPARTIRLEEQAA